MNGSSPYRWLDALNPMVYEDHRIVNQVKEIAIGVRGTGQSDALGLSLGASEEYTFLMDFLRSLMRRGLKGVELVTSEVHEGLISAIEGALTGAPW